MSGVVHLSFFHTFIYTSTTLAILKLLQPNDGYLEPDLVAELVLVPEVGGGAAGVQELVTVVDIL